MNPLIPSIFHESKYQEIKDVCFKGIKREEFIQDVYALFEKFQSKHSIPTDIQSKFLIDNPQACELASTAQPTIHRTCYPLLLNYLALKLQIGTPQEKELYSNMRVEAFITRLLHKRPLAFADKSDRYVLRNKAKGAGGFENIPENDSTAPLSLKKYLSYDEMQLSALINVSVATPFFNNGWRNNRGKLGNAGSYEKIGYMIGIVGSRLEKEEQMEWQHMVITPQQNTPEKGYGIHAPLTPKTQLLQLWAEFYGQGENGRFYFPTYEEAFGNSQAYFDVGNGTLLNKEVYKKRMRLTIEPFLLEANQKACEIGRQAYVHVVGAGLGFWKLGNNTIQEKLMTEVYAEVIAQNDLSSIANIDFAWFKSSGSCGGANNNEHLHDAGHHKITINFSLRHPAGPMNNENADKLLVVSYPADGNSFPGNEYWMGSEYLAASGDPAAACHSMIPVWLNPKINPLITGPNSKFFG